MQEVELETNILINKKELPNYILIILSRLKRVEDRVKLLRYQWNEEEIIYANELLELAENMLKKMQDKKSHSVFQIMKNIMFSVEADLWLGAMGVLCYELEQ